jgi:hypothetical protein
VHRDDLTGVGAGLPPKHSVHLVDISEGMEDALGLFAPEEPIAEADDRADADRKFLDAFRPGPSDSLSTPLIVIEPAPPIAPTADGVSRDSRLGALLFWAALALLVFTVISRGLLDRAAVSRWMESITVAQPPVVTPPPTFLRPTETRSDSPPPTVTSASPAVSDLAPADPPPSPRGRAARVSPGAPGLAAPVAPAVSASDTNEIQSLVGRYLNALTNFDVKEAKAVWPRANEAALSRAFTGLDEQRFELSGCDIAVAGRNANASCSGIVRYVPKVGSKTMFVQRRQWRFLLRNSNDRWFIDNVRTR